MSLVRKREYANIDDPPSVLLNQCPFRYEIPSDNLVLAIHVGHALRTIRKI
jgi:hypothetical protein